ncbi:hypothetical protein N0V90_007422 [Kalmusia sp. IMI 367209]|nr:hypothetical protein N0V90_007422 [Kalmusia sp. IMI 367209]
MPSTRSSNKDASFKTYYTKKAAPQQRYFPHRRKTVRRPDGVNDDGKKQMQFLPEMMRKGTVQDSDDEGMELLEDINQMEDEVETRTTNKKGKKRNSDLIKDEVEDGDSMRPTLKRRRNLAAPISRRKRAAAPAEPSSENDGSAETEPEDIQRLRLRRQSTMTQILDGRLPVPGSVEPNLKPVRRSSRTSWGSKGNKRDQKQQTLTQMVHGLTPLVLDSDEDLEAEGQASAQHTLAEDSNKENAHAGTSESPSIANYDDDGDDDEDEDEYHPTQFIDAPATIRRTPRRASTRNQPRLAASTASKPLARKSPKTRFGLLSTPEKRGVFEIQSSQSPPDSPLSTQVTPRRLGRTPLKLRSANAPRVAATLSQETAETPSKRKQVTFQEGPQEQIPPPTLKKFASTIPDSEDEDGDLSEVDSQSETDYVVREETQALLHDMDGPVTGTSVGAETQAILHQIDQACADADKDVACGDRDLIKEQQSLFANQNEESQSQELGHYRTASHGTDEQIQDVTEPKPRPFSSFSHHEKSRDSLTANAAQSIAIEALPSPLDVQIPSSPPIEDFGLQQSSPMPNDDETPGRIEEPNDDEPREDIEDAPKTTPKQAIQVPGSPPKLQTQLSHSSQAERQLHSEYQSYSQYRLPVPPASSMHVAHDSNYSYQATPFPPRSPSQHHLNQHSDLMSQATTVEPTQFSPKVTPRKIKKEHARSATTTPQKVPSSSQVEESPSKPPPLMIPSSFPSPARVTMEGWGSPLTGKKEYSQWGGEASLEDFSIPAPPPLEWVDDEDEDEDEEL